MLLREIPFFNILIFILLLGTTSCTEDDSNTDNSNVSLLSSEELNAEARGGRRDGGRDANNNNTTSVITSWNDLFLSLDQFATGMRPNATARAIAYIQLAAYETGLPEMRDYVSNTELLDGLEIDGAPNSRDIDIQIALNKAYAMTTDHFLINLPDNMREGISQLENTLLENHSENESDEEIEASIAWGEHVAGQIIAFSQTDASAETQILDPQPQSYIPPTGDGYWTFSAEPERALFPYWESVRTFAISADETSSIPPVSYSLDENTQYYQEMLEVYNANNDAKDEDGEQLWIAEFWSDDVETLMFSPPARQISIANQLIEARNMNLDESLHLLVKVGFALNDAAVSTWADKYEYMVMRPSVYIQNYIDPSYQTNLYDLIPWPNPTFPAYPSGHSTFASAAGGVFIDFFGNSIRFTDRSHEGRTEFRGTPRSYSSFEEMAAENAYSRIPLGVHMRMDCDEGLRLGYEIAEAVSEYRLRRRRS